jgi:hypothetical protein
MQKYMSILELDIIDSLTKNQGDIGCERAWIADLQGAIPCLAQ